MWADEPDDVAVGLGSVLGVPVVPKTPPMDLVSLSMATAAVALQGGC